MSNLQKFNNTLVEFDNEVDKLKGISAAYQSLINLVSAYEEVSVEFKNNNQQVSKIASNIETALLQISKQIEDKTDVIRNENKEFYRDLEKTLLLRLNDNKSEIRQLIESERVQIDQIVNKVSRDNHSKTADVVNKNFTDLEHNLERNKKSSRNYFLMIIILQLLLNGIILAKILL